MKNPNSDTEIYNNRSDCLSAGTCKDSDGNPITSITSYTECSADSGNSWIPCYWDEINEYGMNNDGIYISEPCCSINLSFRPDFNPKYSVSCSDTRRQPKCTYNLENEGDIDHLWQRDGINAYTQYSTVVPDLSINEGQLKNRNDFFSYYINKGFRIIYVDEVMITKSTIPTHEYHIPY